jgi:hypothetical protein
LYACSNDGASEASRKSQRGDFDLIINHWNTISPATGRDRYVVRLLRSSAHRASAAAIFWTGTNDRAP